VTALSGHAHEILWEDGELSRSVWDGEPLPLLTTMPSSTQPSPETLRRLQHAYSLREELDPAWASRPLRLELHQVRLALFGEDPGGEPLEWLVGRPMALESFLPLAIGIASALAQFHRRGLIHKDIKPANVLVNSITGKSGSWALAWPCVCHASASLLPRRR
jgi:serine/threonine protein kinase